MGWYPGTEEDMLQCKVTTKHMLSTARNHNAPVGDVPPGHREDSGKDFCYVEDIDSIFHQQNNVTCAWSATSKLICLISNNTADKMVWLHNTNHEKILKI